MPNKSTEVKSYNFLRIIKINLIILILGLIFVEILLRYFWPVPDPFLLVKRSEAMKLEYIESQFEPNLKLTLKSEEGIPGLSGATKFTVNNLGMRGQNWSSDFFTDNNESVFIVGGSTTECLYLDDTASLNAKTQLYINKLDKNVRTRVFAAGKSGDFTRDHLAMLSQRIVHLRPKYVVLFCGINDLRRLASSEFDPLIFPNYPEANFKGNLKKDLVLVLSSLHLFRRLFYMLKQIHTPGEVVRLSTNYKEKIESLRKMPIGNSYPEIDTTWYKSNLLSMIAICQSNEIELIVMTQATTWHMPSKREYHWMRYINGTQYTPKQMQKKMDEINQITRTVALSKGIQVIDLAKLALDKPDLFYDDCHFTRAGADFAGRLIANAISQKRGIKSTESQ